MSKRKQKIVRRAAMFMLLCMLNQLFFPTVSFALTSMDTQPEVWGYQAVDATDNVSLVSGKFNYTIPVTSIPEFPMAIGYNAGMGMEQEASAFGFGFNGFSGAIARSVNGLPDDLNGDGYNGKREYAFSSEPVKDVNMKTTFTLGYSWGAFGIGASTSQIYGYNNYSGAYGAVTAGLSAGFSKKLASNEAPSNGNRANKSLNGTLGLGVEFVNDSRESAPRFGAGAGLSIGAQFNTADQRGNKGKPDGSSAGAGLSLAGIYTSKTLDHSSKWESGASVLGQQFSFGKNNFASSPGTISSTVSSLAFVFPRRGGTTVAMSTGTIPWCFCSASTMWSKFKFFDVDQYKSGYGFMYLNNYDRSKNNDIADMAIEGEDSYNEDAYNNPSYLQKDNFSVNTMGIAGGMELYQRSYGEVSRNYTSQQTNNRNTYSVKSEVSIVSPWYDAFQHSINKDADILSVLGNAAATDYEVEDLTNAAYVILKDKERQSFNTLDRKFKSDPEFKMRGDYAGEYDLASDGYTDHNVNSYGLIHVSGTDDDATLAWLGVEKNVPIYYPKSSHDYYGYSNTHKIKTSTHIIKHTIGDMLLAYHSLLTANPAGLPTTGLSPTDPFNFSQSFYTCSVFTPGTETKSQNVILNDHIANENILGHLLSMRQHTSTATDPADPVYTHSYMNDLIGSFEVESVNGLRYYFGLPVFNKTSRTTQMSGKGENAPVTSTDDYRSYQSSKDSKYYDRNKSQTSDGYVYPYAWMLTAVVGDDYIDFDNVPGPSDGDIGYWVKFKYVRAADAYQWRAPFTGMEYIPGLVHKFTDDAYSVMYGTKEIYYLSEIESSNYICKYNYQKRFDAFEAKGFLNGDAKNTLTTADGYSGTDATGSNFQFAVTQIDLYKKHTDGNNSAVITNTSPKIIKSTKFYYDYSTSSNVPNNYEMYAGTHITKASLPYHITTNACDDDPSETTIIGTGKLTLRKIQSIAYDETGDIGSAAYLPSYQFQYYGDNCPSGDSNPYNPAYDKNCVDQWGNYMKGAKDDGTSTGDGINFYQHYTEYVKSEADENAKVFKLKTIKLPSGGSMEINYEAESYGYVEDKTPYVMRHVTAITDPEDTGKSTWLTVDVTDLGGSIGLHDATYTTAAGDQKPLLTVGEHVYGELCYYRSPSNNGDFPAEANTVIINEEAIVAEIVPSSSITSSGTRYYQRVRLTSLDNDDYTGKPFIDQAKLFLYHESDEAAALNDDPSGGCANVSHYRSDIQDEDLDGAVDAVSKIIAHGNHMIKAPSSIEGRYNGCYGNPIDAGLYAHWSFLRTPIYKAKYTGSAVSSVKLKDGFNYATQSDGTSIGTTENEYGTVYHYDIKGDGSTTSAGVATTEPGGGKSCVNDILNTTGSGFMPSPTIISSKTTLENLYHVDDAGAHDGDIISRKKGKTSYEFYTPKDDGLQFGDHFKQQQFSGSSTPLIGHFFLFGIINWVTVGGKRFKIKLPKLVPIILHWKFQDRYHTKGYSYTDYTDIFGRMKKIRQIDAAGQEIGSQSYNYYGLDEAVPVYKNGFSAIDATDKKPGKMDQAWGESYYTRTDNIQSIPPLFLLNMKTESDYCYTGMKYSYVPPVLKEVTSTIDGLTTTTSYTGFDYYTGSPVEARGNDSYNNEKINRTVPAYWNYPEMGPRCENDNYINNLTANSGTYMYLNTTPLTTYTFPASGLIGAGVVKWANNTSNTWNYISYVHPLRKYVSSSSYKYVYNEVPGTTIRSAYSVAGHASDLYIKRNAYMYKAYKGYTYEVPLNTNGTFKSFTAFSYNPVSLNPKWKELSTNELYSQNGVLVQSKDVLSKYASQLLGYNFSNTIAAVSNASWGACAYEGAENAYSTSTSSAAPMLESNKVKIMDATIVKACTPDFLSRTLTTASFPHSGATLSAKVLNITLPAIPAHNVPFAKVNITYSHAPISRTFYMSLNDDNRFQVISNVGETFDGFFVYPQISGSYKLLFRASDFTTFSIDNSFTPSGYTVTYAAETGLPDCDLSKPYQVPNSDCNSVHTGEYAFSLAPQKTGTDFLLSANAGGNVTAAEFARKYKALVWVHTSSPDKTELVMQITNSAASGGTLLAPEVKTSKATPYVTAGDWTLLRIDFDLQNPHVTPPLYVHVFVRNSSSEGYAIYDDYRVLPYNADMSNWVFDHKFNRVTSGLDVDNFASYSAYDNRGRVVESKVELQNNGKKTVQKFLYNDQKIN